VVAAALAIGVGANIAVFGFASSILLRPMDGTDPARMVRAYSGGTDPLALVDYNDYLQYRDRNQTLSSLAIFHWGGLRPVTIDRSTEMIQTMPVTGNYFETLKVFATIGRTIVASDDEPGANPVVVLSDNCWRTHFGANPNIIGQSILIKNVPHTIIGVTPGEFQGTLAPLIPQLYVPWNGRLPHAPGGHLIGRLNPGMSRPNAAADLSRISAQLSAENHRHTSIAVYPATRLAPAFVGAASGYAIVLMSIVALVLLIACTNAALLVLTRSLARTREIGIRLALGATRGQLIRQLLTENFVLSVAGTVGALALAFVTEKWLTQLWFPVPMPIALSFDFDWRVFTFAIAASVGATLLFALGPALSATRTDVNSLLRHGGSSLTSRLPVRPGLVIGQIGMCAALLVTAGALVRSLSASSALARGFDTERVMMATVNLSDRSAKQGIEFYEALLSRLRSSAGVTGVTAADNVPLTGNSLLAPTEMRADTAASGGNSANGTEQVYSNRVSPGFFATLKIPVLMGRDFTIEDKSGSSSVAIVNQTLATRFWPNDNPIGRRLHGPDGNWLVVVGVVRNSKYSSLDESPECFLYRPLAQQYVSTATFLIRAAADPSTVIPIVKDEIASLDSTLTVYNLNKMEDRVGLSMLANRAAATVSSILGVLALVLSMIGTYGIMSFLVQRRRREIGLRMALGATQTNVLKSIVGKGMAWAGLGLIAGATSALMITKLLQRILYGLSAIDPLALCVTSVLLGMTALSACIIPAIRASRIDPLSALREQ
jgi:putative ABC transport system permease protein